MHFPKNKNKHQTRYGMKLYSKFKIWLNTRHEFERHKTLQTSKKIRQSKMIYIDNKSPN